jgi:hypothetical protein
MLKNIFIIIGLFLLTSCAVTMPGAFYSNAPSDWTDEQKMVAFYYALQKWGTKETADGRVINREVLSVYDVYDTILRLNEDLSFALKDKGFLNYVTWKGASPAVQRLNASLTILSKCFTAYKIQSDLIKIFSIDRKTTTVEKEGYSTRLITLCDGLKDKLKLDEPSIEKAKEEGRLMLSRLYKISLATEYGEKEIEVRNYKVLNDVSFESEEQKFNYYFTPSDYIEIAYAEEPNTPIVRVYKTNKETNQSYVISSTDEPGSYGFGLPSKLESIIVVDGMDWIAANLKNLFNTKVAQIDVYKDKKPIETHIVRAGEKIQTWEDGEFTVPYGYSSSNFFADIESDKNATEQRKDNLTVMKFYKKIYTDVNVQEIFVPKPEFKVIKSATLISDRIQVDLPLKPSVTADPAYFGTLTYVIYKEGAVSWMLWDSNGDGKFDKRRKVNWVW